MKQLVSILIPAYNAEAWIADTIRSAITQTWPRKEIIVVDDGSTDQTLAVARRFASKEVAVVTQKNQGASAARNHALSLSQGDYILNGSMPMIFCRRTRSRAKWRHRRSTQAIEYCSRRDGVTSRTGPSGRNFTRPLCGAISRRLNGCFERCKKTCTCRLRLGWSVAN